MTLLGCAGKDATDVINLNHSSEVLSKYLPNFYKGELSDTKPVLSKE